MRTPELEQRFARLERDVRRMQLTLLLLLVIAVLLLLAQVLPSSRQDAMRVFATSALLLAGVETAGYFWRRARSVPKVVRAKKFEVVDDRGHVYVEIGETVDGHGAVVTHDGADEVISTPAHPSPVVDVADGRFEASAARAHVARARTEDSVETSRSEVRVSLEYRGDGIYQVVIREPAGEERKSTLSKA